MFVSIRDTRRLAGRNPRRRGPRRPTIGACRWWRASSKHDDVADAVRGPSPHDARESLVYWRERLDTLPRRRRSARREARAMVVAWESRLREAELERWGGGMLGRAAGTVAVLRTLSPPRSPAAPGGSCRAGSSSGC